MPTELHERIRAVLDHVERATANTFRPPTHVGHRVVALLGQETIQAVAADLQPTPDERNAYSGTIGVFGESLLVWIVTNGVPSQPGFSSDSIRGQVEARVIPRSALSTIEVSNAPDAWIDNHNAVWEEDTTTWPAYSTLILTYSSAAVTVRLVAGRFSGQMTELYPTLLADLLEPSP